MTIITRSKLAVLFSLIPLVLLPLISPRAAGHGHAAFSGRNGAIVLSIENAVVPRPPIGLGGLEGVHGDLFTVSDRSGALRKITDGPEDDVWPAWSPDGRRLALARSAARPLAYDIVILEIATGETTNVTNTPLVNETGPAWSPDGTKLAFAGMPNNPSNTTVGGEDIYISDADGTNLVRVTDDAGDDYDPTWSPNGKALAYVHDPSRRAEQATNPADYSLRLMRPDGSEQVVLSRGSDVGGTIYSPSWSPDGRRLVFTTDTFGLWVVNRDGSGLRRATGNELKAYFAAWSPDGKWIAFTRDRAETPANIGNAVSFYKIRPDGSQLTRLIDVSLTSDQNPRVDWGRVTRRARDA